jgi:predicted MFS family arabinose efflux permease
LSTPAAGWLADHFGTRFAFFALMAIGLIAVFLVSFVMPETRPDRDQKPRSDPDTHAKLFAQDAVNAGADDAAPRPPERRSA